MSEIIRKMYENRTLNLRERTLILEDQVPSEITELADEHRLNPRERAIIMALAVGDEEDWEGGATALDLAELFKQRTALIVEQLEWLEKKDFVEGRDSDDGELWNLAPSKRSLIDHPVTQ